MMTVCLFGFYWKGQVDNINWKDLGVRFSRHLLGGFLGLFDSANIHEGRLGEGVPFAVANFLKTSDRIRQRSELTGFAGKYLGYEEWL